MKIVSRHKSSLVAAVVVLTVGACSRSDQGASDSLTVDVSASAADTGMAGMDHSQMAGMDRGPAKDANHEFLRKMSDHHEGLIVMMAAARERASSATAKADARKLHDNQGRERDAMVGMIKTSYDETYVPMAMPSAKTMHDALQQKTGAAYDRDMYGHLIMHHQEAVKMVDDFLPRLTRPDVRQMAEKMRTDQQREIREFKRKQAS